MAPEKPQGLDSASTLGNALLMFQQDQAENLPSGRLEGGVRAGHDGTLNLAIFDSEARGKFEAMIAGNGPLKSQWDNQVIALIDYFRGTGNTDNNPNTLTQAEVAAAYPNAGAQRDLITNLQMGIEILEFVAGGESSWRWTREQTGEIPPGLVTAGTLGNAYLMFAKGQLETLPDGSLPEAGLDLSIFDIGARQDFERMLDQAPDLKVMWERQVIAVLDYFRGSGNLDNTPNTLTMAEILKAYPDKGSARVRKENAQARTNLIINLKMAIGILQMVAGDQRTWKPAPVPVAPAPDDGWDWGEDPVTGFLSDAGHWVYDNPVKGVLAVAGSIAAYFGIRSGIRWLGQPATPAGRSAPASRGPNPGGPAPARRLGDYTPPEIRPLAANNMRRPAVVAVDGQEPGRDYKGPYVEGYIDDEGKLWIRHPESVDEAVVLIDGEGKEHHVPKGQVIDGQVGEVIRLGTVTLTIGGDANGANQLGSVEFERPPTLITSLDPREQRGPFQLLPESEGPSSASRDLRNYNVDLVTPKPGEASVALYEEDNELRAIHHNTDPMVTVQVRRGGETIDLPRNRPVVVEDGDVVLLDGEALSVEDKAFSGEEFSFVKLGAPRAAAAPAAGQAKAPAPAAPADPLADALADLPRDPEITADVFRVELLEKHPGFDAPEYRGIVDGLADNALAAWSLEGKPLETAGKFAGLPKENAVERALEQALSDLWARNQRIGTLARDLIAVRDTGRRADRDTKGLEAALERARTLAERR